MTEPVVLYGTQSNGETLPVQVDDTGRLVAEGLQGQEGPPGPPGQPGADGGDFPLPPDPYEGALLGWLNGGLAWIGTPPVPVPDNVFGPITAWDPENVLVTVSGSIPEEIGTGVYLTQVDSTGTAINPSKNWNIGKEWSDLAVGFTKYDYFSCSYGFDADAGTYPLSSTNYGLIDLNIPDVTTVLVYLASGSSDNWTFGVSANGGAQTTITGSNSHMQATPVQLQVNGTLETLEFDFKGNNHGGAYRILVDGKELVNESVGVVMGRVNQLVSSNSMMVTPTTTDSFVVGAYLRSPSQRVAPWVLYEGDPTSRIDYLRQKRD